MVSLGKYLFAWENEAEVLFTENETNARRLWGAPNHAPFVKDAFHEFVVNARFEAISPEQMGTKYAPHFIFMLQAGELHQLRLRFFSADEVPKRSAGGREDSPASWVL
jgi:hypothetical protein